MASKVTYIGGGGVRTPLVVFGVSEAAKAIDAEELVLYDPDAARLKVMSAVGRAAVQLSGGNLRVRETSSLADAIDGARFVMHSIRVGGIKGRAEDEAACVRHGYCGQETTGVGGAAMAFRTVPIAVAHAKEVAKRSPKAWFISFTNPAGLIAQAINDYTGVNVVGICDTPNHMFHRVAEALGVAYDRLECDYVGLNHLGWIRGIKVDGNDITDSVIQNGELLARFYAVPMFDPAMVRELRLIPTEYLYFYYERTKALAMQRHSGTTRGAEIEKLNGALMEDLARLAEHGSAEALVERYSAYLNRRSGSYMRVEGEGGSAFDQEVDALRWDPFRTAHGYHRVAVNVMSALTGAVPKSCILNVPSSGCVDDLQPSEVAEIRCDVSRDSIKPVPVGRLPDAVQGLVHSVKAYERAAIDAAMANSAGGRRKALLVHPAVGEWSPTERLATELLVSGVLGADQADDVAACGASIVPDPPVSPSDATKGTKQ